MLGAAIHQKSVVLRNRVVGSSVPSTGKMEIVLEFVAELEVITITNLRVPEMRDRSRIVTNTMVDSFDSSFHPWASWTG